MPAAPARPSLRSRLAIGLAATALAAVAIAPAAAQSPAPKVTIWGWPTTLSGFFDTEEDTIAGRIKAELGIEAEFVLVEQNELGPKLKAALPAGQGPDVVFTDFDVMN